MLYQYRIPPLLLVGIVAFLMYFIKGYTPSFELPSVLRLLLPLGLFLTGFLFILLGAITFRTYKTTVNPVKPETASALVTSGIFAISRNPMYVGFLLMLFAWGLYLQNGVSLVLSLLFFFYTNSIQIPVEEKALSALFGEGYHHYSSNVRRWL